jgi:hypothetical protein
MWVRTARTRSRDRPGPDTREGGRAKGVRGEQKKHARARADQSQIQEGKVGGVWVLREPGNVRAAIDQALIQGGGGGWGEEGV